MRLGNTTEDRMKRISNPPVSEYMHDKIARILRDNNVQTVLDIGGVGKFKNRGFEVTDANLKQGIDGTNLPFKDNEFDASISIATLEHVNDQEKFIDEAVRVAGKITVHWFPFGEIAEKTEELKRKLGHNHPCRIPKILKKGGYLPFVTVSEHLLMLASLYPNLNMGQLYDFIEAYGNKFYGVIFQK